MITRPIASQRLIIDGHFASLPQRSYADFHGHSVFTTLRSKNGELCLWPEHWQRLSGHAQFFGYTMPDEKVVVSLLTEQLRTLGPDLKIRIIIHEGHYAITCEPFMPPPSIIYRGVEVMVSSFQPHPQLACYKTGNSLPYALALKEAKAANAFEALLTDQYGHIVDGARTSPMVFDGTTLIALDGGLDGIMRQCAMAFANKLGVPTHRRLLKLNDVGGQLLLANSLMGVVPVSFIQTEFVDELVEHFRMDQPCHP